MVVVAPTGKSKISLAPLLLESSFIDSCGRTSTSAAASYCSGSRNEKAYPATAATTHRRLIIHRCRRSSSKIAICSIAACPRFLRVPALRRFYHKLARSGQSKQRRAASRPPRGEGERHARGATPEPPALAARCPTDRRLDV